MDVNNHTNFVVLMAFAGILAILIPAGGTAMAETVTSVQDMTTVHPTVFPRTDNGPSFAEDVWLILLALGGFLYLINKRSV